MSSSAEPLLQVQGLRKRFPIDKGLLRKPTRFVHAVDDLDFSIGRGESLGLVGESGCGKTTTGRLLTRLEEATGGNVLFHGNPRSADNTAEPGDTSGDSAGTEPARGNGAAIDIAELQGADLKEFRRNVQMIFQDPYESMNPRRTIYDTVAEPLSVQRIGSVTERELRVATMLELVGLTPAASYLFRYPHELSGGQRQRVAIARALVLEPSFVVADEPTSMLDVSIRISIMELMADLARRLGVSYLYITHDLAVARYLCQRIAVMYLGKIVEIAETEELLRNPLHPYTKALLTAVPVPDPSVVRPEPDITGGVSKPINPASTCRFMDRCPRASDVCRDNDHPPLEELSPGHFVSCYLADAG